MKNIRIALIASLITWAAIFLIAAFVTDCDGLSASECAYLEAVNAGKVD